MTLHGTLPRSFMWLIRKPIELFKPMNIQTSGKSYIVGNRFRQYSIEDLERIKLNFSLANKDILGKMNMAEFNYFISLSTGRKWAGHDLSKLFKKLDINRDEYISFTDVMDHLNKAQYEQTKNTLAYAFCKFDKDYDNLMHLHELKEALFYLGFFQAGDKKVDQFFCARDKNNDGRITFEEFVAIVKEDMAGLFSRGIPKPVTQSRISCKPRCRSKNKGEKKIGSFLKVHRR
ncbi:unnamed protein product [Nezara viridula]|uniref:EF-hand domain-containing protein n=1 Tax=Nezara viridula TaxID=85310 RepID=A0A9P0MQ25_NEZVI|nr:unnamed protein product [Nezara viridula]